MDICGIISEYNPFHNGHVLQILETRRLLPQGSAMVSVMSGNFVQRGDFAVMEKYARAKAAVLGGGPDLVLELPLTCALSSAEGFAQGGITLLNACGCFTHLSFGSEAGELAGLKELASRLLSPDFDVQIRTKLTSGISYAAARQQIMNHMLPGHAALLQSPNNTLGVEYLKALLRTNSSILPLTIRRIGAEHDSSTPVDRITSASHLRTLIESGRIESCWKFMPQASFSLLSEQRHVFSKSSEAAMLSYFRRLKTEDFAALSGASEGLECRLQNAAYHAATLDELYEKAKTKRYAMSRIRRMVLCAYLGITAPMQSLPLQYIRVLAMNDKGRSVLKTMKSTCCVPIITKPLREKSLAVSAKQLVELDILADDLYALPAPGGSHWRQTPFIMP